jgi:Borrelia P83/100 protein
MKKGFTALLLLLAGMLAYGLQVDKDELNKGQGSNIVFINYVGPHSRIDTLDEIFGIGRALGRNVGDKTAEFTYAGRYRVIHAIGAADATLLDADIFVIEASAEVDDVTNIMRAVAGYLQAAYAYSQADAMVLARFVVYYNAVFRGDMKYLGSVYKGVVMGYLSPDNAGIGTKYTDWPGKTRMVIPLSGGAQKGSLSAVGAGQLAAPKVIENLQSQPGKALPERKDLTELQQKGIEQGQQQVAGQQEKMQQEKQQLQAQTQALEQSKQTAAQAQAAASAPGATPEQKQAAATAQGEVQKQEQTVQGQQQAVQKQEQAVAAQQQQLDTSQKSVQQQRANIAADEQALIQQKQQAAPPPAAVQPAAPGQVLFIYAVAESPEHFGKLVLIDRVSGKLLTQSDLNSVRGRMYVTVGGTLVVAAGRPDRNGAVRLVTLDPATLVVRQEGKDNLVPTTYLAASDPSVYAVLDSGQGAYLGRFDASAVLQAQSERKVDAATDIVVSGTEVYVQDDAGNILILNKDDLKEKKKTG